MGVALHFSDCHIAFYRHGLQFGGQLLVVGVSLLFFFLFTPLPHVFFYTFNSNSLLPFSLLLPPVFFIFLLPFSVSPSLYHLQSFSGN